MPKLIENVLIGDRVRLAGEDISEVDAKGVRPEVFAADEAPAANGSEPESDEQEDGSSEDSDTTDEAPAADDSAKVSRARGKGTSAK